MSAATKKKTAKKKTAKQPKVPPEQLALIRRVEAAWQRLERLPQAGRLRAGLPDGCEEAEAFEIVLDNHYPPEDFWLSLARHDGERAGAGPTLCDGLRMLSLAEIMEYEDLLTGVLPLRSPRASGARVELAKGELAAAAAAEGRMAARSRAKRSKDPRISPYGPTLTLTLAIGTNGRRIALDLATPDVESASQIVEYRPDGTIVHVAQSVTAWLEGLC